MEVGANVQDIIVKFTELTSSDELAKMNKLLHRGWVLDSLVCHRYIFYRKPELARCKEIISLFAEVKLKCAKRILSFLPLFSK